MTLTNVELEGFNDWSDKELADAKEAINYILERRKNDRVRKALVKFENAFIDFMTEINEEKIHYFKMDGDYSLGDIFEEIHLHYRERWD